MNEMKTTMRALTLYENEPRKGISLDDATWKAIDYLSKRERKKWSDWAMEQFAKHPEAINRTAVLRYEAMKQIFDVAVK
jgi:hypothetical protein